MDLAVLRALNGLAQSSVVAGIAEALSSPWVLLVAGGPVLVWLLVQRRARAAAVLVVAVGLSDLVSARILKPLVDRPRPCAVGASPVAVVACGPGRAFPSTHASNAGAFAAASAIELGPWGGAGIVALALAVAGSRVVLGLHYPSDVLGGLALGIGIGLALRKIGLRAPTPRPPLPPASPSA